MTWQAIFSMRRWSHCSILPLAMAAAALVLYAPLATECVQDMSGSESCQNIRLDDPDLTSLMTWVLLPIDGPQSHQGRQPHSDSYKVDDRAVAG